MLDSFLGPKFVEHPLIRPNTLQYRVYQQEIAKRATERNTLVILPTALGKTAISILVAVHILYNYRKTRLLMMAPTRPLVLQHAQVFVSTVRVLPQEVCILTGRVQPQEREKAWRGVARVFFATPEVVRNDIEEGRLSLRDFDLLVFDECHRAVKNYAYTFVAQHYLNECPHPLILGTTASPGSSFDKIDSVCKALGIEQIEYRTEVDPDVSPYVHRVDVRWCRVPLPSEYSAVSQLLKRMLDERVKWLWEHGYLHIPPSRVNRRVLLELGEKLRKMLERSDRAERGPIFTAIRYQSISITLSHALELLESQGISSLRSFINKMESQVERRKTYAMLFRDPAYAELRSILDSPLPEHPKMEKLLGQIKYHLALSPSSRVLVFTQYRDTASHLAEYLRQGLDGVRVERFVGQSQRLRDSGLRQKEQLEVLRRFKDGETRVLVATSIAEEGLDIPSVDLVVFYEPVPSEIRYIQRKGRTGRISFGKVLILVAESKFDLGPYFSTHRKIKRMLSLVRDLNLKLQQLQRQSPGPSPDPMTDDELKNPQRDSPFQVVGELF